MIVLSQSNSAWGMALVKKPFPVQPYLIGKAKHYCSCTFITKNPRNLPGFVRWHTEQVSSWLLLAFYGSSRVQHHTANLHPPHTGLSCSTCWCEAARCKWRRLACSGRGQKRDGLPRAGWSLRWHRCHRAATLQCSWRGCEPGSGGYSLCPIGRTQSVMIALGK